MRSSPDHRIIIDNRYKEIDKIGEGMKDKVYKVRNLKSQSKHALKIFEEEKLTESHDTIKENLQ